MKKPARGSSRKRRVPQTAPGLGVSGAELEARRLQRLKTVAVLQTGRTPLQMVTVAEAAVTVADDAVRDALVRDPPRAPSACKEGCAWCCYQRVGTVAPEVLRIAAYLVQTLTPGELDGTRARVNELAEHKRSPKRGPGAPLTIFYLQGFARNRDSTLETHFGTASTAIWTTMAPGTLVSVT